MGPHSDAPYTKIVVLGIHVLMAQNIWGVTINLEFWMLRRIKVESTYIPLP